MDTAEPTNEFCPGDLLVGINITIILFYICIYFFCFPEAPPIKEKPSVQGFTLNRSSQYFHFLFISQECDQVHIDDVASDDNGQDLR